MIETHRLKNVAIFIQTIFCCHDKLFELAILLCVDVAEPVNEFIDISPKIVFQLGQQVFADVLQKNFANLTF